MKSSNHLVSRESQAYRQWLDKQLAACFASAGIVGVAAISSSEANAAVVSSGPLSTKFGPANGGPGNIDIDLDIDSDGEIEFQLRHMTNTLGENYLELDKRPNDIVNAYPDLNADGEDEDWEYLNDGLGNYPAALPKGFLGRTQFNPPAGLDYDPWQDTTDYNSDGVNPQYIRRANRLIDYDSGVDELTDPNNIWDPPAGNGNFLGLGGVPHYIGFQIDFDGGPLGGGSGGPIHYGWVGVKITDDATASGELIGYGYESTPLTPVHMGHFIPEPATLGIAALGGVTLASSWIGRRLWRK